MVSGSEVVRVLVASRSLLRAALPAVSLLVAVALRGADAPVLMVVPPASDMARVEAARASVPASRALLTVGAAERVPMREGVELVLDRTFSDAPPADLVIGSRARPLAKRSSWSPAAARRRSSSFSENRRS